MIWAEILLTHLKCVSHPPSAHLVGDGGFILSSASCQVCLGFYFKLGSFGVPLHMYIFSKRSRMGGEHIQPPCGSLISRISPRNFWWSVTYPHQNKYPGYRSVSFLCFLPSLILLLSMCQARFSSFTPNQILFLGQHTGWYSCPAPCW